MKQRSKPTNYVMAVPPFVSQGPTLAWEQYENDQPEQAGNRRLSTTESRPSRGINPTWRQSGPASLARWPTLVVSTRWLPIAAQSLTCARQLVTGGSLILGSSSKGESRPRSWAGPARGGDAGDLRTW